MGRLFVLMSLAVWGCSSATPPGSCTANDECAGGSVCTSGGCLRLCVADRDCSGGEICTDSACVPGFRNAPEIADIDGDGSSSCPGAGGNACVRAEIRVLGNNLLGASFSLVQAGTSVPLIVLANASDTSTALAVPDTLIPGGYILNVVNGAGSADQAVEVLRGEAGADGPSGPMGPTGPTGEPGALDASQVAAMNTAIAAAVPAGTIVPFGGSTVPAGWLLCDGATVDRATYAALFAAIGIAHGGGNGTTTFHLPDLRGRFLRGVNHDAAHDPDAAARTAPQPANGTGTGSTGNAVGSVQGDQVASHVHSTVQMIGNNSIDGVDSTTTNSGEHHNEARDTGAYGGNETRPKNVAVEFIIKH